MVQLTACQSVFLRKLKKTEFAKANLKPILSPHDEVLVAVITDVAVV